MKIKKNIRKIHRWVGLIAATWLLLLATTGLLLQHSEDWELNSKFITNPALLKSYGIGKQYIAYKQGNQLLQQVDKQLIQNQLVTIKMSENITSAIYKKPNWIIATKSQIYWVNKAGQIIQSLDKMDGLPLPILDIGLLNNSVIIKTNDGNFNLESLETENLKPIKWSRPLINEKVKQKSIQQASHDYISYQQVIFDLHAGITSPSIFNDIAAISLILLSVSGIFLFFRKKNHTSR